MMQPVSTRFHLPSGGAAAAHAAPRLVRLRFVFALCLVVGVIFTFSDAGARLSLVKLLTGPNGSSNTSLVRASRGLLRRNVSSVATDNDDSLHEPGSATTLSSSSATSCPCDCSTRQAHLQSKHAAHTGVQPVLPVAASVGASVSRCRFAGDSSAYILGTRDVHAALPNCDDGVVALPREAAMLSNDATHALITMRAMQHNLTDCTQSDRMVRATLIESGFASAFQLNAADLLCSFVTNRVTVIDDGDWKYGCEAGNKYSCFFEDIGGCVDPSNLTSIARADWNKRGQCSREVPPAFAPHDFNWFWGAVQAYQFRHKPRAGAHTSCLHHHVINAWAAAYHAVHGEVYPGYRTPVARGSAAWGDFKDCIAAGDADASAVLRAADVSFPRPRTVPRADAATHTPSYTRSSTHGGIVVGTHLRRGDRMMHDKRLVGAMEYFQELAWLRHEGVHIAGLILATDDDETNVQALTATRLRLTMPGPAPPAGGSEPLMPMQYDFVNEADPAPNGTQWDIPFALIPSQFVKPANASTEGPNGALAVILAAESNGVRRRVATEDIMNVISILSEAHAVMGLCMSQVNRMIAGMQLVKNNTFHRPMASDYKYCVSFSGHLWPIGEGFVPIHTEYARNGRRRRV